MKIIELLKIIKDLEIELYETKKDMDNLITYLAEHDVYITIKETRKLSSRLDEEEQC